MKRRLFVAVVALALGAQAGRVAVEKRDEVKEASPPTATQLTIYSDDFALVREKRRVELSSGVNSVKVTGVAAHIEPASVAFRSLTAPESVVIREQNYQYDLVDRNSILNRCVGKRIRIIQRLENGDERAVEGILLNAPVNFVSREAAYLQGYGGYYGDAATYPVQAQSLVLETSEGHVEIRPWTDVIAIERLPEGLISKPQLVWKLETTRPGNHSVEVSFLTRLLNWEADYVAVVGQKEEALDLTAWVTITNNSGAAYRDASLQLMAGDVRRVREPRYYAYGGYAGLAQPAAPPGPQFAQQPFFEYHLYTLEGTTSIADKETKQMTLLSAAGVPVKKVYLYDPMRTRWFDWLSGAWRPERPGEGRDTAQSKKVAVALQVDNARAHHLGIPLPAGKVKVYKSDSAGRLQFVGEDRIDHTPMDEKLLLWVGSAFDLVGERRRTDYRQISSCEYEESFEITLRNHKDAKVEIIAVERLFADWEMLSKSHACVEKDAHTLWFPVSVPGHGEVKITYRVRTRWC
jgi:hypothetical protein